jgi:hypothetical protein
MEKIDAVRVPRGSGRREYLPPARPVWRGENTLTESALSSSSQTQAPLVSGCEASTITLFPLLRAARRLTSSLRPTSGSAALSASAFDTRVAKTQLQIRTMSGITIDTINQKVKDMQYAVRGAIVSKAGEIEADLAKNPLL